MSCHERLPVLRQELIGQPCGLAQGCLGHSQTQICQLDSSAGLGLKGHRVHHRVACQPLAQSRVENFSAKCFSAEQAAPLSTVPAEASGTFNPLCKVLCILQSLYLCSVGPMPDMLTCGGYTPLFKLQSQATLLLDPSSHIWMAQHTDNGQGQ